MPHIHEKIDFTVEVFIVYKNKVLLRMHDKLGFWLSVGGHIELNEDPNQAALREVREEVGLAVELYDPLDTAAATFPVTARYRELIPPVFMNRHNITDAHEHVTLTYFARAHTDKLVLSETEKSKGVRWFSREELSDPQYGVKERIQHYAQTALDVLSS